MVMNESERQKIIEAAKFLEDKGYTKSMDDYSVIYSNKVIEFIIGYERYDVTCDINIRFIKQNKFYVVGWIAVVRSDLNVDVYKGIKNLLLLLSYIKDNYDNLIQMDYCEESRKLIAAYLDNM